MGRLLRFTALASAVAFAVTAQAAVRGVFEGEVVTGTAETFTVTPGDDISGAVCIDTATAPPNGDPESFEVEYSVIDPDSPMADFLKSSIELDGSSYSSRLIDEGGLATGILSRSVVVTNDRPDSGSGTDAFFLVDDTQDNEVAYSLILSVDLEDGDFLSSTDLSQSFTWDEVTQPAADTLGSVSIFDEFGFGAIIDFELTSLVYSPITEASLTTGLAQIPAVEVGEQILAVDLQLIPGSSPLTFEIASINPSTLPSNPGNATYSLATGEGYIPSVRLDDGRHVEVRLQRVPDTSTVKLTSARIADCL
jgi:hypothetical protein